MASCIAGRRFEVDKNAVDFSSFVCTRLPKHSIRRTTDSCSDGKIAEIGFQTDQKWLPLMRVCHNETIAATKWVQYKQKPANRGYQSISKRESKRGKKHIDFVQADFYKGTYQNIKHHKSIFHMINKLKAMNTAHYCSIHTHYIAIIPFPIIMCDFRLLFAHQVSEWIICTRVVSNETHARAFWARSRCAWIWCQTKAIFIYHAAIWLLDPISFTRLISMPAITF